MPAVSEIVRRRKRRAKERSGLGRLAKSAAAALALLVVLLGLSAVLAARVYAEQIQGLPPIGQIEAYFGPPGAGHFTPTRIYDRDRRIVLLELIHPLAEERRWLSLDPGSVDALPQAIVQATIAAQDPTFWTNPGYESEAVLPAVLSSAAGRARLSIAQQLVEATLLAGRTGPPGVRHLQSAVLADELTRRYSKEQILLWYLNSADYGNFTFGIDAAALVYFGKHASDLSLAEIALLAAVPRQPEANPADDFSAAKRGQAATLQGMAGEGFITEAEAEQAASQPLSVRAGQARQGVLASEFARYVLGQLDDALGSEVLSQGGLTVTTTLDGDLQLQAACTAETHLRRLQGGDPGGVVASADGSLCLPASFLPPLRPRDAGVDHNVSAAALVVLDPSTGEVLALAGVGNEDAEGAIFTPRPAGSALYPFIYLTAFSEGYAPASLTLDIPPDAQEPLDPHGAEAFHGPVRMRTALANAYPQPAQRTQELAGVDNVLRTARQMGIFSLATFTADLAAGGTQASLIELAQSYGVMADRGQLVGRPQGVGSETGAAPALTPSILLGVEDPSGRELYRLKPETKAVLSPQLAYLTANVLSDEAARWPSLGPANPLEVGRPAGALASTPDGEGSLVVGFTPQRVVAVWVGNGRGAGADGIDRLNGAAPIWHAVMRYATRDLPPAGWEVPAGVSTLEVCDPSGLLPTEYCPVVTREVFIQGTEPTAYDNLYQPFRINRETGKLATLFTPLELVEERVYLVPPPEAAAWAEAAHIERPPVEYDLVDVQPASDPDVAVTAPEPFATVHGQVEVRGRAAPDGFGFYRLQVGEGLNPSRWVQLGGDEASPVTDGFLGAWDTSDLNGLYILQLVVVLADGRLKTAAVPLTVDNEPPQVDLISPRSGQVVSLALDGQVRIDVEAEDARDIARVEVYVDERRVALLELLPYALGWTPSGPGTYTITVRAYDEAGNVFQTLPIVIQVVK